MNPPSDSTEQRLALADALTEQFGEPPPFQDSEEALQEAEVLWTAGMDAGMTSGYIAAMKPIDRAIVLVGPKAYLLVTRAILRHMRDPMDVLTAIEIEQAEALLEQGDTYFPPTFPPGFQSSAELRRGFARQFVLLSLLDGMDKGGEQRAKWHGDFHHALGYLALQREENILGLQHFAHVFRHSWLALTCFYAARQLFIMGQMQLGRRAFDGLQYCPQEDLDHLYDGLPKDLVEGMKQIAANVKL